MTEDYDRQILDNIPKAPPTVPRIDPSTLDIDHEVTSADGLVTAVANGRTQQLVTVLVASVDDVDAVGTAAAEAINAALDRAAGLAGLNERIDARMAVFDASLDRVNGRLDVLSADLDGLLSDL